MCKLCAKDEQSNEIRRNPFEISAKLGDSNITAQIIFVDTFEGSQEISDIGPQSFDGVCMNFSNTIAIIIASPLMLGMTNGLMLSNNMVISLPLVGIANGFHQRELMNMGFQGFTICMMNHA